ncbi:MAG: methylamine utilization protein MauJ, partial [Acidobacteriota bacterium]
DFVLDSDLCLADGAAPLTLQAPDGAFSLVLSNAEPDPALPDAVLSAQLIFDADSLDENIRTIARDKLAEALNYLTYATNRKFTLKRLKRLIDWTPGLIERNAIIYVETPEWDMAEPALEGTFLDTAERLLSMHSGEDQMEAMRWYRLGIQSEVPEEQFSYFWFALEIAAETLKGIEKVPSKCPQCQEKLFCEKCGNYPTHRRYAGEAIQQVIERVHPKNAEEVFRTLQLIRHTLMHGRRIASVLDQLPCDEQQAVNKLAFVTWKAIGLMFSKPDPRPEMPMTFGYSDNLIRRTLVAGARVVTTLVRGDPNNPQLADFPAIQFEAVNQPINYDEAGPEERELPPINPGAS